MGLMLSITGALLLLSVEHMPDIPSRCVLCVCVCVCARLCTPLCVCLYKMVALEITCTLQTGFALPAGCVLS